MTLNKCYIIHLDRASARKAQVSLLVDILPFEVEVVSAVDAQEPSRTQNNPLGTYQRQIMSPRYPNALRPSEIACFQSHRKCWQSILDNDLDFAIILEDDVSLDMPVFIATVNFVLQNIKQGDFVRFPYKRREDEGVTIALKDDATLRLPREIALGMQTQIVTREAARQLLRRTEVFDRPVDCFIQMQWENQQRILTVWPSGVSEISSEIGGSMINHKNFGLSKLKRELMRPIYRKKISRLSQHNFEQLI